MATDPSARPWRITQTAPPGKALFLGDYSVPFGRPRHGAVVSDSIEVRHQSVFYPGNSKPTRHTFGVRHGDWSLSGRWMNSQLSGIDVTKMVQNMKAMVADQVPVRVAWGDIVAATGLIVKFEPNRESGEEVAWTLVIAIDSDDSLPPRAPVVSPSAPSDNLSAVLQIIANFGGTKNIPADIPFQYPCGLLDSLDGLVSSINGITGSLVSLANGIDSFQRASAAELARFRGGIGQLKTALLTFQGLLDDPTTDAAVGQAPARSQLTFAKRRAEDRANAQFALALLALLDDRVKEAQYGKTDQVARVTGADSWETIAQRSYGSSDKADTLRQANAARGGKRPRPGRPVHIPRG